MAMSDAVPDGWRCETSNDPASLIDCLFAAELGEDNSGPGRSINFGAFASSERLRWIFPCDARVRGFLSAWQPTGRSRALIWRAAVRASTAGLGGLMPGITRHAVDSAAVARLAHRFGHETAECLPAIYIGTIGYRRKAVIGWMDRRGACVAVGKFPLGRRAIQALANEAKALAGPAAKLGITMPALLHWDAAAGLLLQSSVAGRNCAAPFDARHCALLVKLVSPQPRPAAAVYAGLVASAHPQIATSAKILLAGYENENICPAQMHGDFTQANLKQIAARELALVDWEYYSPLGAPLADAVYFQLFRSYFINRLSGPALLREMVRFIDSEHIARLCEAAGIELAARRRFACLGLLAVAQSRVQDGLDENDAARVIILDVVDRMAKELPAG